MSSASEVLEQQHDETKILEDEIAHLESQLATAKQRLSNTRRETTTATTATATNVDAKAEKKTTPTDPSHTTLPLPSSNPTYPIRDTSHHYLLLLSDSALPLGSFAFSSGLESYLAHARFPSPPYAYKPSFTSFLPLSVSSYASTSLPFVLAAHRDPTAVAVLDDTLDASIICAVGRRASVAQGRALLSIWEKSFAAPSSSSSAAVSGYDDDASGREALIAFSKTLKKTSGASQRENADIDADFPPPVSAHLAPLFGAVSRLLGLTRRQAAYVFLLGHAKALVSAAVRASMFGPYQAQRILAGGELQALLADVVEREWDSLVEAAGQSVPAMDLWIGRHEMLYSRIFNS